MRWDVLTTLRDRITSSQAVIDYIAANQYQPLTGVVGFPRPKRAQDYPYVGIVPVRERGQDNQLERPTRVSIASGLIQPAIDDGTGDYLGMRHAIELADLIVQDLIDRPTLLDGVWFDGGFESFSDLGSDHPTYWIETIINLQVRSET